MTATWTAPKTWVAGVTLTAADMNQYVRDNMDWLKAPPKGTVQMSGTSNFTTTSTSFVDVSTTDFQMSITTTGGAVFGWFVVTVSNSSGTNYANFDVVIDGVSVSGASNGVVGGIRLAASTTVSVMIPFYKSGLSAAAHTIKLQFRSDNAGNTVTVYANVAGATGMGKPTQFCFEYGT